MVNIKSKIVDGWLHCSFIVEMMGKPKEHLQKTLQNYVENLKKDKKIEFISEDYAEPEQLEKSSLFTTFVELELLMKSPQKIIEFCFDFMPSSVEIIEPTQLNMQNQEFNGLLNDLQARLHKIDMLIKNFSQENKILKKNSAILVGNSILLALKNQKKKISELSKDTKVPESELKKFLEMMIKDKRVKLTKDIYSLV